MKRRSGDLIELAFWISLVLVGICVAASETTCRVRIGVEPGATEGVTK